MAELSTLDFSAAGALTAAYLAVLGFDALEPEAEYTEKPLASTVNCPLRVLILKGV